MSAGSLFQIAGAIASQLRLSLSRVLKLQESMRRKCLAGSQEGDNETCDESDYHRTVDNNSAGSRGSLRLKDDRPTLQWQPPTMRKGLKNK